jgi:hypothetical protein
MAKKEIAVGGCTLSVTIVGGSGSAVITGVPDTKSKAPAGGQGVFFDKVDFQIPSGAGIPGVCLSVSPYSDSIAASSTKTRNKVTGKFACRKDDQKIISIPGQHPTTGVSCSIPATVKIANAGQTKARTE